MQAVRVLIVDDSAVTRRLLGEALASDPEIEVAGTAGNGSLGLARILEVKPDLITLHIEMPALLTNIVPEVVCRVTFRRMLASAAAGRS